MNTFLTVFILSLIAGTLWRIGGSDLNVPFKSKWRDWGVTFVSLFTMWSVNLNVEFWYIIAYFFLCWGSLLESCDHWGTENIEWYERMLSGFLQGVSALPIALYTHRFIGFTLRTIILTIFMPFSDRFQFTIFLDDTDGVEGSRGFVFTATLPLLLL